MKKFFAELIGTFMLVFVGTGAVVFGNGVEGLGHLGIALAFGLSIVAAAYSIVRFPELTLILQYLLLCLQTSVCRLRILSTTSLHKFLGLLLLQRQYTSSWPTQVCQLPA